MTRLFLLAAAAALLPAGTSPLQAQKPNAVGLFTTPLAGQKVAVLPITVVIGEPGLPGGTLPPDRAARLAWADSVVGEELSERAPEIAWVLPPELRRIARRNAGMVRDPDLMGQAIMRSSSLKTVPDPLRSSLRGLAAVAGGRFVFIPAAVQITAVDSTVSGAGEARVRVLLSAVLVDVRTAGISWRTSAPGQGLTATEALRAAVATMLPVESDSP